MPNIFPPIQRTDMVTPDDQVPVPSVLGSVNAPSSGSLALTGAQNQLQADTPQQYHYGAHGVLGNVGHVLERFGNIAGDILDPGATALIPGSDLFKQRQMAQDRTLIQQATENKEAEQKESDTVDNESANREQKGDIDQAHQDTAIAKTNAQLAGHGFKLDPDKGIVPLSYEELSPTQQAAHDLKQSQGEQAEATAQLRAAQAANAPEQIKIAQEKLASIGRTQDIALQRIGLTRESLGFQQDKFYNPQPTAQERNKGDLAQSSIHQIGEMRDVLDNHPEIFGPGAGRGNRIQQWLGSSDPDAIKYRSSSQYLADHSAALFGGRGEYIMKQLHDLTDERFGPDALKQALTEAENTSQGFKNAGTTHSKGGKSNYAGSTQSFNVNGKTYNIPADQVNEFKKDFPNAK